MAALCKVRAEGSLEISAQIFVEFYMLYKMCCNYLKQYLDPKDVYLTQTVNQLKV